MCEYMTDEAEWPERTYRMVEIAPGIFAMRDVTNETDKPKDT